MTRYRSLILLFVTLLIGFGAGFVLRPIIMPPSQTAIERNPSPPLAAPGTPRGTQYFEANIDTLYSEDVPGLANLGSLRVVNPFG